MLLCCNQPQFIILTRQTGIPLVGPDRCHDHHEGLWDHCLSLYDINVSLCCKTLQCFVDIKIPSHTTEMMTSLMRCQDDVIDSYLPDTATPARSKARTERNFLLPGLCLFSPDRSLLQTSSSKDWRTFSLTEDLKRGATSLKTRPRLLQENGRNDSGFTFQRGVGLC